MNHYDWQGLASNDYHTSISTKITLHFLDIAYDSTSCGIIRWEGAAAFDGHYSEHNTTIEATAKM